MAGRTKIQIFEGNGMDIWEEIEEQTTGDWIADAGEHPLSLAELGAYVQASVEGLIEDEKQKGFR